MKATIEQLAWYIERDGFRCTEYRANGGRRYEGGGGFSVEVPAWAVDELDARCDRVFAILHKRNAKENR